MPPTLPLSATSHGNTSKSQWLQQSQRGAGSPHTQDVFYCHSQCYKTHRPIFCYCISTSSFHPLRFTPWLSRDQELQKAWCDLRLAQTRCWGARALSRACPAALGVRRPGLQASCDTVQLCKLQQPAGEAALEEASLDTLPHAWAAFQLRAGPLSELRRFVCTRPFALPTLTLPWWFKFWCYLGPTHHYRALWWPPGFWLTLVNIANLLYPCLATPPARSLPCLLCCHAQLPACLFLSSNPLGAPWQVE